MKYAGERSLRRSGGSRLLLAAIFAGIFIITPIIAASEYAGSCGSCCNSSARVQAEERHWTVEAYRFLYCDQCYPPFTPAYQAHQRSVALEGYLGSQAVAHPAEASDIFEDGTLEYWQAKGNELYLAGSFEQAAAAYSKAIKLNNQTDVWLNLGNSLFFLGKYQEALNSYDARLAANPQDENAWKGRVQSLLALNRTVEAEVAQETLDILQSRNITPIGSASSGSTGLGTMGT
ncbi:MAG TPA: tetratricopeptide repeat protein [Methanothrix soehngenii]|nr:tetratricopeptide repeat protein [Methanothrix soehngenii]